MDKYPLNESDSSRPGHIKQFEAAVTHVSESIHSGNIPVAAAKGILYSLVETIGALVGDPDLPERARFGYQALLEKAQELSAELHELKK